MSTAIHIEESVTIEVRRGHHSEGHHSGTAAASEAPYVADAPERTGEGLNPLTIR
jgi:hypothetical protein